MQSPEPLVSIITPSFNQGLFIEEAILCVKDQNYPNIEHLIIDGGSTDGTLDVIRRYEGVYNLRWVSEPDEGQADALNKGFKLARGEVLGWLNADDTYQPGAVRSAVTWLQSHPAVDLVYGHSNYIDESGEILHTNTTPRFSLEKLLWSNIIPQAAMFFRGRIVEEIGGVKPHLHYVMDWEFVLRIARNYKVQRVPVVWGNFRITPGTKSVEKPYLFWPEALPVLQGAIEADYARLGRWADDVLTRVHLFAALEYARCDEIQAARKHVRLALAGREYPRRYLAGLVPALVGLATHPWHRGCDLHPDAHRALDGLGDCLPETPPGKQLAGYLSLYRGFEALREGQLATARGLLGTGLGAVGVGGLLVWPCLKMMLAVLLGTRLVAKALEFKDRLESLLAS
jgi:glycosyltransferase involved in cell wall biosynthesis